MQYNSKSLRSQKKFLLMAVERKGSVENNHKSNQGSLGTSFTFLSFSQLKKANSHELLPWNKIKPTLSESRAPGVQKQRECAHQHIH